MELTIGTTKRVQVTFELITNLNLPTPVVGELFLNALLREADQKHLEDLVLSMPSGKVLVIG